MDYRYVANLHDKATVIFKGEFVNGVITMITERGINLRTSERTDFYKWHQVVNVSKIITR